MESWIIWFIIGTTCLFLLAHFLFQLQSFLALVSVWTGGNRSNS